MPLININSVTLHSWDVVGLHFEFESRAIRAATRNVPQYCPSIPLMTIFTESLNLTITIAGAICCLLPAILLTSGADENFRDNSGAGADANRSPILVGFLFVVLIPASDLILNLLSRAAALLNPNKSTIQMSCSAVTRLSEIERLLFMTGMAIQSLIWFLPGGTDLNTIGVLDVCLHGCSRILVIGPIILFLQRCTVCCTGFRTFLMLLTGSLGTTTVIFNFVLDFNEIDSATLSKLGNAFQYIAIAIYLYVITSSAITYSMEKMNSRTARRVYFAQLLSLINSNAPMDDFTSKSKKDFYTNYIPGLHILFSILLSAADAYETSNPGNFIGEKRLTVVTISFIAQTIVLVMELRIWKDEVARGLVSYTYIRVDMYTYMYLEIMCCVIVCYANQFISTDAVVPVPVGCVKIPGIGHRSGFRYSEDLDLMQLFQLTFHTRRCTAPSLHL